MIATVRALQRYVICGEIASGGMAAVHLGKLRSGGGFSRIVAIKVMHAQFAKDADFRAMFLDEARIVARIRHPSVVSTLDILDEQGELFLVMDYVHGPALSSAVRAQAARGEPMPIGIAVAIIMDALDGLHAAHEAKSESGEPLGVVHRDVSPQNVLVGTDGLARVADFGIATAADRLHLTRPGEIKGKVSYMAPEQLSGGALERRADVYAVGIMLFELLTGQRAFTGDGFADIAVKQLTHTPPRVGTLRSQVGPELEAIVDRALEKDPAARFSTARAMSEALASLGLRASAHDVGAWVVEQCPEFFAKRDALVAAVDAEAATALEASGEAPEAPTVTAHVGESRAITRRRTSAALGVLALAGGAIGVTIAFREGAFRREAPSVTMTTTATATTIASVAPQPSASFSAETPSTTPAVTSAPPVGSPSQALRHRLPPPPPPVVDAGVARILLPCCEGGLRVRFRPACDDETNCPSH
jgi:serine/threonine-protein kinase